MRQRESNLKNRKIAGIVIAVIMAVCMFAGSVGGIGVTASASSKADYQKSYKNLEKKCKQKFTYSGTQLQMNKEASAEYKLWDKELNRVYKEIKSSLTSAKANKLVVSERKWIKKRDKKATKAASGWVGGTGYTMVYKSSLTTQTKKRIKWLIKNYA